MDAENISSFIILICTIVESREQVLSWQTMKTHMKGHIMIIVLLGYTLFGKI